MRRPAVAAPAVAAPAVAAVLLLAGGCVPKPVVHAPYYGPTDPLAVVVERINERNGRIVSLRAEGDFSADLIDPTTKKHTAGDGDVTLLYTPPNNLRLSAKVFTEKVFDIGSNADRYWLVLPREDTMYWGTHAGESGGRAARLPVRPDLLAEVLAVTPLPADLLKEPAPTLRFDNDDDAYVLSWQVRLPDRWATQKEVRYDRRTLLPNRVRLYDVDGRAVVSAAVSDPRPVDGYTPAVTMPARYDLFFPDTGSTFSIRLTDLQREHGGAPNARTFAFPGERAGVTHVESLDR